LILDRTEQQNVKIMSSPYANNDARKVRSLLEINKTLAKENTLLSQQFDVLSKECATLHHLVRSRQVLNNARELELKSELEAAKQAIREKEEILKGLEQRLKELEARLELVEATSGNEGRKDAANGNTTGDHNSTPRTTTSSTRFNSPNEYDTAYLEANHPWLSPILLRLEQLSSASDSEFKVQPDKRFSPSRENENTLFDVDLTLSGEEDSKDAVSCTCAIDNIDEHSTVPQDRVACKDATGSSHFETPEPLRSRQSLGLGLKSVKEDVEVLGNASELKTPVTGSRSSLRQRKMINYALPSLNAKLRRGDAHTFGVVDFERGATPRRK
jgi:hypothetical protein